MNRSLIITIGIVIILIVLGLWVYLLIYGTPHKPQEIFSNLGIIQTSSSSATENTISTSTTNTAASTTLLGSAHNGQLQQLTTRAVAGFSFIGGDLEKIRYVERGTGYVYEIDQNSSTEKEISNTTIPQTTQAAFSPDGNDVVFTSYGDSSRSSSIGTIGTSGEVTLQKLPINATNISFKDDTAVYYTLDDGIKTTGYVFDLKTSTQSVLFSQQLSDLRMLWGNGLTYMYLETKPTANLEGYAYLVTKNSLNPISDQLYGLSILANNTNFIETHADGKNYVSSVLKNGIATKQPIIMVPEKCVFNSETGSVIWCAAPLAGVSSGYLENWYKGILTSHDYLWSTDLSAKKSVLIGDLSKLSGRTIDVDEITISNDHMTLLFRNKIDGSLWSFVLPKN